MTAPNINLSPVWVTLGAISIGFHLALIFTGLTPNLVSRPLHLLLAMPWIFIAAGNSWQRFSGWLLLLAGSGICAAIAMRHSQLGDQYGFLSGNLQLTLAAMLIVVVLELARRAISWPLPAVAALSLLYLFFGQHVPGNSGLQRCQ